MKETLSKDLVCEGPQFLLHPSAAHKAGCPLCNPTMTVPELNAAAGSTLTSKTLASRLLDYAEHRQSCTLILSEPTREGTRTVIIPCNCGLEELRQRVIQAHLHGDETACAHVYGSRTVCIKCCTPFAASDFEPRGTFQCPICGRDTPHMHSGEEIAKARGAVEPKAPQCGDKLTLNGVEWRCTKPASEHERQPEKASEPPLPAGWVEHSRHGDYVEGRRGHESAMFHLHMLHRPPTVHYCTWLGRVVECCACGKTTRLPENGDG
jgi:hypothetical protein